MVLNEILRVINSLSLTKPKVTFSWAEVNLWPENIFEMLLESKLIKPSENATSIICQQCEYNCSIDVIRQEYPNNKLRYYAVCEEPLMIEEMGRLKIPKEQIKQWYISLKITANALTNLLGLDTEISYRSGQKTINLGAFKTKSGRQSVLLNVEPLSLKVNQSILPIDEVIYIESNKLALDLTKIEYVLNLKQQPPAKTYRANTDKKEQRKANTQAMYQDWQEQAIKLKTLHPTKSKTWIAQKIVKMPMAQGKSAETIRRNINI